MKHAETQGAAQRGIALIAVLWIVAALSIAVTGVVHTVRSETRAVAAARRLLEVQATGEAAIALVLQGMTAPQGQPRPAWGRFDIAYEGQSIAIEVRTLNGLVDINRAPPELLALVYAVAGGLGGQAAQALAQATVEARQQPDAAGRALWFDAVEDMIRVPGINYDLYARLRPLVTADAQGSGKVNAQAAPQELLTVLAEGNAPRAATLSNARLQSMQAMDTSTLRGEFIDNTVGSRYLVQAHIPMADGSQGVVLHTVDLSPDQRAGLPWRILSAETWMRAASESGV